MNKQFEIETIQSATEKVLSDKRMTQEHNGAASGVTNEGSVLVCLNYGDQYLTAENMKRNHKHADMIRRWLDDDSLVCKNASACD